MEWGGKAEKGEGIKATAIRETEEEIGVKVKSLGRVAVLDFYFTHSPDWDQQVVVFVTDDWEGEPKESEEMKPKWFKFKNIPYSRSRENCWLSACR